MSQFLHSANRISHGERDLLPKYQLEASDNIGGSGDAFENMYLLDRVDVIDGTGWVRPGTEGP